MGRTAGNINLAVLLVKNLHQFKANTCVASCDDVHLKKSVWLIMLLGSLGGSALPDKSGQSFSVNFGAGGCIWVNSEPAIVNCISIQNVETILERCFVQSLIGATSGNLRQQGRDMMKLVQKQTVPYPKFEDSISFIYMPIRAYKVPGLSCEESPLISSCTEAAEPAANRGRPPRPNRTPEK